MLKLGEKLRVANVEQFLKYEERFGVLIRIVHGYAVRDPDHYGTRKEEAAIVRLYFFIRYQGCFRFH
jgi:hypothetical protein